MTGPDDRRPGPAQGPEDPEYSATVLASHWIQRPEPDPGPEDGGTFLRFGPGVTAALAHRTRPPLPLAPPDRPRRRLRRHALPALVLLCVLAFLAWQRLGPAVEVRTVSVEAGPALLGCGQTAEIVARVTTNGRPGTLSYRWIRSDGTASAVLRERLTRGQRQASLRLRWTFEGEGHLTGRADLRILAPTPRTVTARVTYLCA
jgi:hypothetical protein